MKAVRRITPHAFMLLLVCGGLLAADAPTGVSQAAPVPASHRLTAGPLEIHLDNVGNVTSVATAGRRHDTPQNVAQGGFLVIDYAPVGPGTIEKRNHKVNGTVEDSDGTMVQEATVEDARIRLRAQFEQHEGYLRVVGEIEDLSGRDRGVDLVYRLPVDALGWRWWGDTVSQVEIEPGVHYGTVVDGFPIGGPENVDHIDPAGTGDPSEFYSIYPVGCVASVQRKAGVALAVSADHPCVHSIEYDSVDRVLLIRFRLGLIHFAKPHLEGKAPFGFLIYPVDSYWGFRDALARYYKIHADTFRRMATKDGLLLEHTFAEEKGANPDWDPGYFSCFKGSGSAKYFDEPKREALGIDSYAYVLPGASGLRSMKNLEELPAGYEEAMKLYRATPDEGDLSRKQSVEIGSLRDRQGRYVTRIKKHFKFPVNPDPDLPGGKSGYLYEQAQEALQAYPTYDGIYSDSFSGWGEFRNYRRGHFQYADIPLAHDEQGRAYIWNTMSHREWLIELKKRIQPYGGLVMGNGIRAGQLWTALLLDVLKVESDSVASYPWYRAVAYHKPFHISANVWKGNLGVEEVLKNCTLYDLLPTRMGHKEPLSYEREDADLIARYVPAIIKESFLEWEPVTHAVASDPDVRVERYGPNDREIAFAVCNTTGTERHVELRINASALAVPPVRQGQASGLIGGRELTAENPLRLDLGPREVETVLIQWRSTDK